MSIYPRNNIEVAQNFFEDCQDFLMRYDSTIESFSAVKSRRLKCFTDLRAAYECALKCVIAYHQPAETERHVLICAVEQHGHKIESPEATIAQLR